MNTENLAHFLLRAVVGILFILFGWMKFIGSLAPPIDKIITFLPLETSILLMGIVEAVIGVLVLVGLWTRVAAWLGALLMATIILSGIYLGLFWQFFLIKDISMLVILIALGLMETREWTVDHLLVSLSPQKTKPPAI